MRNLQPSADPNVSGDLGKVPRGTPHLREGSLRGLLEGSLRTALLVLLHVGLLTDASLRTKAHPHGQLLVQVVRQLLLAPQRVEPAAVDSVLLKGPVLRAMSVPQLADCAVARRPSVHFLRPDAGALGPDFIDLSL